jgi:hypothetical protein
VLSSRVPPAQAASWMLMLVMASPLICSPHRSLPLYPLRGSVTTLAARNTSVRINAGMQTLDDLASVPVRPARPSPYLRRYLLISVCSSGAAKAHSATGHRDHLPFGRAGVCLLSYGTGGSETLAVKVAPQTAHYSILIVIRWKSGCEQRHQGQFRT